MKDLGWLVLAVAAGATAEGGGNELMGWSEVYRREIIGADGFRVEVPMIVYGTAHKGRNTESHVSDAIKLGYRGFDTANQPAHYDEASVGLALEAATEAFGLSRENFFLQTKFTPAAYHGDSEPPFDATADGAAQVRESLQQSLRNLRTTYLDSYIVHDPMTKHEDLMVVWRAMEEAYAAGTVKLLGISNVNVAQLARLLADAKIKPTFVQNRLQSTQNSWDQAVRDLCKKHGVIYQGYSLIGSNRFLLEEKGVVSAAKWHGVTRAQVLARWALAEGVQLLVSPQSYTHKNDNLELGFELSAPEIALISNYGHAERGLKYTGATKIEAKMWNEMHEELQVFWANPAGGEVLSFTLPAKQTEQDAQTASTFHGHRFNIRNRGGRLVKSWTANANEGEEQSVKIDLQIKAVFQSMFSEPLDVFWVSPDGSEVSNGALNVPVSSSSVGVQPIDVGTWHGHKFVVRNKGGQKVHEWVMDMTRGSSQIVTVPRSRGERF